MNATATTTFDNLTDAMLADAIGDLDATIKNLQARMKEAKAEFIGRGLEKVAGERFTAALTNAVRWSLDTKAVKDEMGEDWYTARSRITPTTSLRIAVNKAALAKAA
jgi:hypothetical protein